MGAVQAGGRWVEDVPLGGGMGGYAHVWRMSVSCRDRCSPGGL